MSQLKVNNQTALKPIVPAFNQAPHPIQHLTEERIREVVIEILIELDVIPRAQKKKAINIE